LKALRDEVSRLQANPPASSDIGARVDDLVAEWAVRPEVRGFAGGQTLDVLWGGNRGQCGGVCLMGGMFPRELRGLIIRGVTKAQPLSVLEHRARYEEVTARIHELSYIEAALVERHGNCDHNIYATPMCILGVRLSEDEPATGDAAA